MQKLGQTRLNQVKTKNSNLNPCHFDPTLEKFVQNCYPQILLFFITKRANEVQNCCPVLSSKLVFAEYSRDDIPVNCNGYLYVIMFSFRKKNSISIESGSNPTKLCFSINEDFFGFSQVSLRVCYKQKKINCKMTWLTPKEKNKEKKLYKINSSCTIFLAFSPNFWHTFLQKFFQKFLRKILRNFFCIVFRPASNCLNRVQRSTAVIIRCLFVQAFLTFTN